jgi:DNA polymerase III epsilon subunit-like protein
MSLQVMIDLETMSTRYDAAICSIGAVKFSNEKIIDTFYITVDASTCKKAGLHICKDTVAWWNSQNREALMMLVQNTVSLDAALGKFEDWYGTKSLPTWGNGAAFDNVIMDSAFKILGKKRLWKYHHDRCYRTIKAIISVPEDDRVGTYHNALDDAMHQTNHLIKILYS